jgi:hypothetical protein
MLKLPNSTLVDKIIPKSSFEEYATSKQKKLMSALIGRIRWQNKLSRETLNLQSKQIDEIQVFELELKEKGNISDLLLLINKVIPYQILFVIRYNGEVKYSVSKKHSHPTNENQMVVDWTFSNEWMNESEDNFEINLTNSLDFVFQQICFKISGKNQEKEQDVESLIKKEQQLKQLNISIEKIMTAMQKCKQFNKKVELNKRLQELIVERDRL